MDRIRYAIIVIAVAGLAFIRPAMAASSPNVHLVGPAGLVRAGDTVSVEVRMDSLGRIINAVDLHLAFSSTQFELLRVERQQSIWTLWPEEPGWDNHSGTVSLVAGRPHGLVAIDAPVATLVFRSLASGIGQISLQQKISSAYLNDGQGTRLDLTSSPLDVMLADTLVQSIPLDASTIPTPDRWTAIDTIHVRWTIPSGTIYSYRLSSKIDDVPDDTAEPMPGSVDYDGLSDGVYFFTIKSEVGDGVWSRVSQYRFLLDREPPSPFSILLLPSSQTNGQPTMSWTTTDTTSGVADAHLRVGNVDKGIVTSPLVIKPEWRGHDAMIIVRDQAGNERAATIHLTGHSVLVRDSLATAAVVIVVGGVLFFTRRQRRR